MSVNAFPVLTADGFPSSMDEQARNNRLDDLNILLFHLVAVPSPPIPTLISSLTIPQELRFEQRQQDRFGRFFGHELVRRLRMLSERPIYLASIEGFSTPNENIL